MKKLLSIIGITTITHVGSLTAWAVTYPVLRPANTQVIAVFNPRVDFALRIALSERATGPIETVVYGQGLDPDVGLPILNAYRRAHNRGIPGKHIFSNVGSILFDPLQKRNNWLADARLQSPAHVINVGGLYPSSFPHQKFEIYNAGTPNEVVLLSGRNRQPYDFANFDLTIIMRRIDPSLPYIGDQIRSAHQYLWDTLSRRYKEAPIKSRSLPVETPPSDLSKLLVTDQQRTEFDRIDTFLRQPVNVAIAPLPFESRPEEMNVVTSDLIATMATGIYGNAYSERIKAPNDILDSYLAKIRNAKQRIDLMYMNVLFPDSVRDELFEAMNNDVDVHLFTNGEKAQRVHVPLGAVHHLGLEQILAIFSRGKPGKFHPHLLSVEEFKKNPAFKYYSPYTHRKVMLIDKDIVAAGSDNCNVPGLCRADQILVWAKDARLAKIIRDQIAQEAQIFVPLTCEQALVELKKYSLLQRGVNWIAYAVY